MTDNDIIGGSVIGGTVGGFRRRVAVATDTRDWIDQWIEAEYRREHRARAK